VREQGVREQGVREQGVREQGVREQGVRGPGVRAVERPVVRDQGPESPNPRRFESLVGIDDSTAGRGSVIFRVLVEGRERFASPIVRGGDRPLPVSVDIRGARRLELEVDYADRADVLDHADWLDARLTR
jgi:hypothetical protein